MSFADFMHVVIGFLGVDKDYQALGPFWGAIFGAMLTAGVVGGVVQSRTKRHQEATALFEFSKRFHQLVDQAHDLAKAYKAAGGLPTEAAAEAEAAAYYRKFFDLLVSEYYFFMQGFVRRETFLEWMNWRWGAWHDIEGARLIVCGITYQTAWREWSQRPLMRSHPLVWFVDEVHAAPDLETVRRLVYRQAPGWRL
jgi:hypothetical protein